MFRLVIVASLTAVITFALFHPMLAPYHPILLGSACGILFLIAIYDFLQTKHTIRRNFPVIGWARYLLESIGDELRQYWFLPDHEVRPFDRERLRYIYRSAKGLPNGIGFGTERNYRAVGEIHLLPSMFPTPDEEMGQLPPIVIGPDRKHPYLCPSPINISGMSFGSLSEEAVRALSSGAALADIHMLTGEGALTPYHLEGVKQPLPFSTRMARMLAYGLSFVSKKYRRPGQPLGATIGGGRIVVQIGPAKFGFRTETGELDWDKLAAVAANPQVVAFEIKLAQGAKPGVGGVLPKEKITPEISAIRGIPMDRDCISPSSWDEFHDPVSLIAFLAKLQDFTGKPVGFKMVAGQMQFMREIGEIMRGTGKGPDFITIDGGEGGTGAAPLPLADMMGRPILHGLPLVDNILREYGVRDKVILIASGKIVTGGDVAVHIAMGADMVNIARGFLISLGCIQAMKCHTNQCPTGIATQNAWLRRGLDPMTKYVRVANYARALKYELLMLLKSCGVRHPWELSRHHVTIVVEPGKEVSMAERHPYPDGDDGKRNPQLAIN